MQAEELHGDQAIAGLAKYLRCQGGNLDMGKWRPAEPSLNSHSQEKRYHPSYVKTEMLGNKNAQEIPTMEDPSVFTYV